jgi:hypothetical protein
VFHAPNIRGHRALVERAASDAPHRYRIDHGYRVLEDARHNASDTCGHHVESDYPDRVAIVVEAVLNAACKDGKPSLRRQLIVARRSHPVS